MKCYKLIQTAESEAGGGGGVFVGGEVEMKDRLTKRWAKNEPGMYEQCIAED